MQRLGTTVRDGEGEGDALADVGVAIAVSVGPDAVYICT